MDTKEFFLVCFLTGGALLPLFIISILWDSPVGSTVEDCYTTTAQKYHACITSSDEVGKVACEWLRETRNNTCNTLERKL